VADAAVDDAAEIQRVMADLDTFVTLFAGPGAGATAGTGGEATPAGPGSAAPSAGEQAPGARAAEWAAAIVAARASLGADLSTLTAVPPALAAVAPDLPSLKEVLQHFFTYTAEGAYYPRWSGAGRDGSNPAHLTPAYREHNVGEHQLERDRVYLYGVMPESLLAGGGDLGGGAFREFVVRFDPTGIAARPFTLATVHTVRTRPASAPFCDLVFFSAAAGLAVPVTRETRAKLSAGLAAMVAQLAENGGTGSGFNSGIVTTNDDGVQQVHLIATVEGEPALPPGVTCGDTGPVRMLLAPPDQVAAVAALPEIRNLGLLAPSRLTNDQARSLANWPALDAKMPAGKKGGQGVLIGVIDSGIDGSHPAFAGRLHAVWDQGVPVAQPGTSPLAHHPAGDPWHAAYHDFNFGVELTGPAVTTSRDINFVNTPTAQVPPADGHGTHVSATAAGAEVRDGAGHVLVPAGVAPLAKIAVVRAIQASPKGGDEVLGARWIFQKATELGVPCVINMSFGQHFHGHDGVDDNARGLLQTCRDAAGHYLPGRILVASAGNDRQANMHVHRTVPAHSGNQTTAVIDIPPSLSQFVEIWIRDPSGTKPAAFPLGIYFYRKTGRRNTFHDVSRKITLGTDAVDTHAAGRFPNHKTRIDVTTTLSHPINGDHRIRVLFRTTDVAAPFGPMLANQWGIAVVNDADAPVDVDMYIPGQSTTFLDATRDDDHAYLVGQPAASAAAISVASCISRLTYTDVNGNPGPPPGNEQTRVKEISTFSSPGPLRPSAIPQTTSEATGHEVNGIDVTAPGGFTQSALSSQVATPAWLATPGNADWVVNTRSRIMTGTSMATPVVTGLVATILADEPTLTMPQVLARLKAASAIPPDSDYQAPAGSGPKPLSADWGYGLVDAAKLRP
jgi:subtilisin family serine protease